MHDATPNSAPTAECPVAHQQKNLEGCAARPQFQIGASFPPIQTPTGDRHHYEIIAPQTILVAMALYRRATSLKQEAASLLGLGCNFT